MFARSNKQQEVLGLLDIGTSKISCSIVQRTAHSSLEDAQAWHVLGHSQIQSAGIRAGMLVDLDQAEQAVRQAIGLAEDQAGMTLDEIIVGVSNGRLQSIHFSAAVDLAEHHVQRHDLRRLAQSARQYVEQQGRTLLYLNNISYTLDHCATVLQPLGLRGRRLDCQFHAVTTDETTLLAFEELISRCCLSTRSLVPSGLASAFAATTNDERQQGVVCIDIGAGSVNFAVIHDGMFLHVDTLAFGGANLTHDVSATLSTSLVDAERIKTLYGTMVSAASDLGVSIEYELSGNPGGGEAHSMSREVHTTTRADVSQIIYPRALRQLELIGERLSRSGIMSEFAKSIVLTGGGSQLVGLSAIVGRMFSKPVRIGQPQLIDGLEKTYINPSASTLLGLGLAESLAPTAVTPRTRNGIAYESYLKRMEQWLRESF